MRNRGILIGIPSNGFFTERRIATVLNYELRIMNYELTPLPFYHIPPQFSSIIRKFTIKL